jgi:hypothetical protein
MFNTRIKKNNLKKIKFQLPPPRLDLPPKESTDLEELKQFVKMFKQRRIKLGNKLSQWKGINCKQSTRW